jgi:hypothetical protein
MKIVKSLLLATLVLMLSATAMAVPNSQQLGPYAVSFDINSKYQAQIAQPIETETAKVYKMLLSIDNSTYATIGITEYAEPTDATLKVHKTLMPMNMILREGLNASIAEDKVIDGKDGFLVTSKPFVTDNAAPSVVYRAMYWLDSEKCECGPLSAGRTNVVVTSTFPKDITENLLSSLHVVKVEATSQASAPGNQNQGIKV